MTGIPIYNVTSNCSTGANALILAKQLIETGQNDCVLAVGFEKMERGSLGAKVSAAGRANLSFLFLRTLLNVEEVKKKCWELMKVLI